MDTFVKRHAERIVVTVESFDGLRFLGTVPKVNNLRSLLGFLYPHYMKYRDFGGVGAA